MFIRGRIKTVGRNELVQEHQCWRTNLILIDEGEHIYKEIAKLLRLNPTHFKTVI